MFKSRSWCEKEHSGLAADTWGGGEMAQVSLRIRNQDWPRYLCLDTSTYCVETGQMLQS